MGAPGGATRRAGRALARGFASRAAARTGPRPVARDLRRRARERGPRRHGHAAGLDELERRFGVFLAAIGRGDRRRGRSRRRGGGRPAARRVGDDRCRTSRHRAWTAPRSSGGWRCRGPGELAPAGDVAATSRAWYDELRLSGALAAGLREAGLDEGEAWTVADQVRVLLSLPRPSGSRGPARTADARLLERWLASDVVRTAIGVNTWEGVEWLDRDRFAAQLEWARRLDAIEAPTRRRAQAVGPDADRPPHGGREGRGLPARHAPRGPQRCVRQAARDPRDTARLTRDDPVGETAIRPTRLDAEGCDALPWRRTLSHGASRARLPDRAPTRRGDAAVKGIRILGTNRSTIRPADDVAVWARTSTAVTETDR